MCHDLVAGVHDGLGLPCALYEESLLDGKELDMIRCSSWQPDLQNRRRGKQASGTQSDDSSRGRASGTGKGEHTAFGILGPAAGATLDGDGEPSVRRVPTGPATPFAEVSMVHCGASGGQARI